MTTLKDKLDGWRQAADELEKGTQYGDPLSVAAATLRQCAYDIENFIYGEEKDDPRCGGRGWKRDWEGDTMVCDTPNCINGKTREPGLVERVERRAWLNTTVEREEFDEDAPFWREAFRQELGEMT